MESSQRNKSLLLFSTMLAWKCRTVKLPLKNHRCDVVVLYVRSYLHGSADKELKAECWNFVLRGSVSNLRFFGLRSMLRTRI